MKHDTCGPGLKTCVTLMLLLFLTGPIVALLKWDLHYLLFCWGWAFVLHFLAITFTLGVEDNP